MSHPFLFLLKNLMLLLSLRGLNLYIPLVLLGDSVVLADA